jgi:hypothetical protein
MIGKTSQVCEQPPEPIQYQTTQEGQPAGFQKIEAAMSMYAGMTMQRLSTPRTANIQSA